MTKTRFFTVLLVLALLTQVFVGCQQEAATASPSEEASQNASVALPSGTEVLPSENPSESTTDTQPSETPTEEKPTLPEVAVLDEYELLLYAPSVGGSSGNIDVPQYTGNDLFKREAYSNSTLAKEKTNVFNGREISLEYDRSYKDARYKDGTDVYENDSVRIQFNSTTGKIVYYEDDAFVPNREYVSEVTPQSSEAEFLAYAKKMLREISDVSVEGWNVEIMTVIIKEDGSKKYEFEFVNDSDTNPDFTANYEYRFTTYFSDGILRPEEVIIGVTNVGEIWCLAAMVNDAAYRPFENVKIDRELLKEKTGFSGVPNDNTRYYCYVNDTELWIVIEYDYTLPEGLLVGELYLVKVAEIVKNEKVPDEEIKEPSKDNSSPTEEATGEYRVPTVEKIPEKISD